MQATMITHAYWLAPTFAEKASTSFAGYMRQVFRHAPREAMDELRVALALNPGDVYGQLHFSTTELVGGGARHRHPPIAYRPSMVAPILLGSLARRMIVACGASGLYSAALYRPNGGATNSMHKRAAAFDVRLLKGEQTPGLTHALACVAAWIFRNGAALRVSVGTYQRGDRAITVHFDAGRTRRRSWTYSGNYKPVWMGPSMPGPDVEEHLLPTPARVLPSPWEG